MIDYYADYDSAFADTMGILLALFTFPHLDTLFLQGESSPNSFRPFRQISEFLERSNCPLTVLALSGHSLTDQELVSILARLPSLQELSLENPPNSDSAICPISTTFVQSLHASKRCDIYDSTKPLLPRLRSLVLRVDENNPDPSAFVESVSSRWLPHQSSSAQNDLVCLRSVELHLQREMAGALQSAYNELLPIESARMTQIVVAYHVYEGTRHIF
ncbi:hypothetical protein D9757_014890 [Collybiopsis confluens]|uniref:Uncharacterized protein n=1 Tax=Collybiopsis confluens TaxID=2823264 RepID=A0A8H5FNF6_9AGAR|nr:hypothetical protein D9757_014890 [Collybiopsis confluens]